MSSSDRILFLTGGSNFKIDGKEVDQIPFRNVISITNKQSLTSGAKRIGDTFKLASYPHESYYGESYADLNSTGLQFKIPSKNILIQVDQHSLNLEKKVFTSLSIEWSNALLTRSPTSTSTSLSQSKFISYSDSGSIEYSSIIPNRYYISRISEIVISSSVTIPIPAGDLYIHFFQF